MATAASEMKDPVRRREMKDQAGFTRGMRACKNVVAVVGGGGIDCDLRRIATGQSDRAVAPRNLLLIIVAPNVIHSDYSHAEFCVGPIHTLFCPQNLACGSSHTISRGCYHESGSKSISVIPFPGRR